MESSNNIIHPTRLKVHAFDSSCFGRVMMSVRLLTLPLASSANLLVHQRKQQLHSHPSKSMLT
jgi:hypothetical protein